MIEEMTGEIIFWGVSILFMFLFSREAIASEKWARERRESGARKAALRKQVPQCEVVYTEEHSFYEPEQEIVQEVSVNPMAEKYRAALKSEQPKAEPVKQDGYDVTGEFNQLSSRKKSE